MLPPWSDTESYRSLMSIREGYDPFHLIGYQGDSKEVTLLHAAGGRRVYSLFDRLIIKTFDHEPFQEVQAILEFNKLQDLGVEIPQVLDYWYVEGRNTWMMLQKKVAGQSFMSILEDERFKDQDFAWVLEQAQVILIKTKKLTNPSLGLPNCTKVRGLLGDTLGYAMIDKSTNLSMIINKILAEKKMPTNSRRARFIRGLLADELTSPAHCVLTHGDFSPHNILIDIKNKRITALIDFEYAMYLPWFYVSWGALSNSEPNFAWRSMMLKATPLTPKLEAAQAILSWVAYPDLISKEAWNLVDDYDKLSD